MLFTYGPQLHVQRPGNYRIVKAAPRFDHTLFSPFTQPYYAPRRLSPCSNPHTELAPLFQLFENTLESLVSPPKPQQKSYSPRFDARETEDAYEIRGDLPDIESQDLHVEFSDAQTLVIRGGSDKQIVPDAISASAGPSTAEAEPTETTTSEPANAERNAADTAHAAGDWTLIDSEQDNDARSTHSDSASSYQRPTVEDEETGEIESASAPETNARAETHASKPQQADSSATVAPTASEISQQTQQPNLDNSLQESIQSQNTTFQRTFRFQSRIDQDNVRATFDNGLLRITVPKATVPSMRTIVVY